jgi:uncharacterized protein
LGWSFEWNDPKDALNRVKHGVCFGEAQRAFLDPRRVIVVDEAHSEAEPRYFCRGMVDGRVMTVRFTVRGNAIRIIGAGYSRKGHGGTMRARTADYTDDQGEIVGDLRRVADTLPSPDQLVLRDDTVKVTLALSRHSVDFFKHEAAKQRVPYQRMIRALIDEYTRRMQ